MTKAEFQEFIKDRIVLLDGATGSNLQKRGMPTGVCPELWITEHADVLKGLQREYVDAGSNIVYAPTFSGNRIKMSEYGLGDRLEEINTRLVQISREAVGDKALVAGDITMTGAQLEPMGDLTFSELLEVYKEQLSILSKAGVDLIVVETMMSLQETRAAVLAAKEVCPELPVMATLSFTESGNTLYGASAESAVVVLQEMGVDAVGLNCSAGPDKMLSVVRRMREVAKVPLIAKPNAGLPQMGADGQTYYDMDANAFADSMKEIIQAGAHIIGGCCGTAPAYIERLKEIAAAIVPAPEKEDDTVYLANERQVYEFEDGQTLELGDGIDFTKDGDLLDEYRDGVFDSAQDTAFDLQDDEADALLFCAAGLPDEADILKEAVFEVTQAVRMPVVIASKNPQAVDQALSEYSGIAGVMCLSADENLLQEMKNTLKRYSAKLVTLDKEIVCC